MQQSAIHKDIEKNPQPPSDHLLTVISQNIREALHSFKTMRALFYENTKDIPYTNNLFKTETIHVLHVALFSSMIASIGRLMDQDRKSASIPTAMRILRRYEPTEKHIEDLWQYNLSNWKYDFNKEDVILAKITSEDKDKIVEEYLGQLPEIETSYSSLIETYEPVKIWRDKHIAHSDSNYASGKKTLEPIPKTELIDFLDALKSMGEMLCGKLYQTSIDTSDEWADIAAAEIIDYAYQHQLGVVLSNYIDRHSPNPEQDNEIFVQSFNTNWETPEGKDLVRRTLDKRDEIKRRILSEKKIVTRFDIDNG